MPLIESLTLSLGNAVARTLFRLWAREQQVQRSELALSELIQQSKLSFRERRGATRTFERIADEVSERLVPFLEVEFATVKESEINAAILAVGDTLEVSRLDDPTLFATDLDPLILESVFRAARPTAAKDALLSEAGTSIYDFTLREVSAYITEIVITLPEFDSRAAKELLVRESALFALTKEILDRLPELGVGGSGEVSQLEAQYRREVARKLDRLELFGVRTSEINRRYALSVAYIGLTAATHPVRGAGIRKKTSAVDGAEKLMEPVGRTGSAKQSIHHVLSTGRRHLIRGEAGSGKTTLLQWLAVSGARQDFGEELVEWNDGIIPFLLRLRRFVGDEFPLPSEFPSTLNRTVGERMPDGWAIEMMEQGRALVLIDGVDELKEEERPEAAEWLRDIISSYPEARYVVTSRPGAVSEQWLEDLDFAPSFLESMDVSAIDALIDHWHRAAQENVDDEDEMSELAALAEKLQLTVRSNSQIRNLATSPLLCAMLCALNRDWRGQLPEDRVELYRVGLEMLLERRDAVRGIKAEIVDLSRAQKEVLLQAIALWLLENGFTDGRVGDLENRIASKIESMPRLEASPNAVLKDLLIRSGLLREPVDGRIDFIHRTFQEYLAAKQLAQERSVGILVNNAAKDHWQEVLVLAVGLGNEKFASDLLQSLLKAAGENRADRHRLQLIAVACLETAPVLAPDLQTELNKVLSGLIPPRSMAEAKAIASAGEVAVPLLAKQHQGNVATVAPSVRALSLIGGFDAMASLERFSRDSRLTVAREVIRGWEFFPTDEYAERVLSKSPLDRGRLTIRSPEQLLAVRYLTKLDALTFDGQPGTSRLERVWDWDSIERLSSLRSMEISFAFGLTDIPRPRDNGRRLQLVQLSRVDGVTDIDVRGLNELRQLHLFRNRDLERIDGMDTLSKLQTFGLTGSERFEINDMRLPETVISVLIREIPLKDLQLLDGCTRLAGLSLRGLPDLTAVGPLANCAALRTFEIENCPQLTSIAGLEHCLNMAALRIEGGKMDECMLQSIPPNLRELTLSEVQMPASLESLPTLSQLTDLSILLGHGLVDISAVGDLTQLTSLTLIGSADIASLDAVANLKQLRRLDLEGCRGIHSLEALYGLPHLEWVDLRGVDGVDAEELRSRGVEVSTGPTISSFLSRRVGFPPSPDRA